MTESGPISEPLATNGEAPSLVLSTSGTTGVPKGLVHCENAVFYAAEQYAKAVHLGPDDVWVSFHPVGVLDELLSSECMRP